jgi:nucleosome binding factor SPN SPT16 subunit
MAMHRLASLRFLAWLGAAHSHDVRGQQIFMNLLMMVRSVPAQEKGQGHLVGKLTKSIGFSVGTELRESHYQLTAKNAAVVQPGMVFNVSLGGTRTLEVN